MTTTLKIALPILVVALGVAGAAVLISARPEVETQRPDLPAPLVRVMTVKTEDLELRVLTQGTVAPRTESTLLPEVVGRVVSASEAFEDGGFFEEGEILLTIDPRDYELAAVRARARVAEAQVRLEREEEEAKVARREWESLGEGEPTGLALREPQLAEARALIEAARADLQAAELDLERTRVRAPYAGRVREKLVDVGQYVTPGTRLAQVYAVDYAEVRLPIPDTDLAFIDLPLDYRGGGSGGRLPRVILRAEFAGRRHRWDARLVRTEGELDPRSRMVHVVARAGDPYGRGDDPDRPPLAVGMFVEAEILGREAHGVVVIPRSAFRGSDQVLVVDGNDRLRFRQVEVLKTDRERVIVSSGLADGERICLSPLEAVVDGMKVRTS
jgi:RND family efflux transporter MFP subunit